MPLLCPRRGCGGAEWGWALPSCRLACSGHLGLTPAPVGKPQQPALWPGSVQLEVGGKAVGRAALLQTSGLSCSAPLLGCSLGAPAGLFTWRASQELAGRPSGGPAWGECCWSGSKAPAGEASAAQPGQPTVPSARGLALASRTQRLLHLPVMFWQNPKVSSLGGNLQRAPRYQAVKLFTARVTHLLRWNRCKEKSGFNFVEAENKLCRTQKKIW